MGRKMGSGEGSIYKTSSGWRGQISLGGTRKSVSGKTKKEVIDKIAELRIKYNSGSYVKESTITVAEWVNHWLNKKVEPNLTEQSMIRLRAMFDNHVLSQIGKYKLQDLTKPMLEEMYATSFHHKQGKKYKELQYSHATVNSLSVQFKKCLQYAVECGLLDKNPHVGVELHKLRPPKKIYAYSLSDHAKIVDACKYGKKTDLLYYFLISTGLRFGEAAALTWDDIDFEEYRVSINKTAVSIHGSMIIQDHPKTAAGNRFLYVSNNLLEWLYGLWETNRAEVNYRNLVFTNNNNNIINQANAILRWKKLCSELDIPYQGMHSLRHTWATRALEKGIDVKTVSTMLGHKNVITTMNIYQDALSDRQLEASEKMADLF